MKLILGSEFLMGSEDFYLEEAPVRKSTVGDFWIDQHPVTNAEFAEFVDETGYVTFAEVAPDPRDYPGMDPSMAQPGSAVFTPTTEPVDLRQPSLWWSFIVGADWRHPRGPGSSSEAIMDHPVVQIAYSDAAAYARWAGKRLPSEAEWEFAARGGLRSAAFAWGDELSPEGTLMANYWQGQFPYEMTQRTAFQGTSPVGAYPANGFGLNDMIGNVWEWTSDWFSQITVDAHRPCCGPPRSRTGLESESYDPLADLKTPRRVTKGGSHLCAPNYCQRYRPAARHPQPIDSPTSHTGFRCIVRRE